MPFCPKCKNEYRPGIKMCSDCKVELVDDLNNAPVALARGIEESLKEIQAFLNTNGLQSTFITYDKVRDAHELYADKKDVEKAAGLLQVFQAKKQMEYLSEKYEIPMDEMTPERAKELMEQEMEEAKEAQKNAKGKGVAAKNSYVDKRQRAEEYKSSGYVLTIVGIIGLLVLTGMYTGMIPGFESLRTNYMFLGVMGALFVVFIAVGIMSFTKIKTIIGQAEVDEDMTAKVKAFMEEKLTKTILDKIASGGVEEELFFQRAEYMEREIKKEFPDIDDALCEKLIDERYSELYEDNDR